MKYVIKTTKNENGNVVFAKERKGKGFVYLAKSKTGEISIVTKDWILNNRKSIANVGVSKDLRIYPLEVKPKNIMKNLLKYIDTHGLTAALKRVNASNLDKHKILELLKKEGYDEVEMCEVCGSLEEPNDYQSVYYKDEDCYVCWKCLLNTEGYTYCKGCGENSSEPGCFKKTKELNTVLIKDYYNKIVEDFVCDEYIDNYATCEKCGCYCSEELLDSDSCCPNCSDEDD